jgi:hypothetical protein
MIDKKQDMAVFFVEFITVGGMGRTAESKRSSDE